jgi:uncharacterized SAM-binding protein YcdF (DUF218 family)
MNDKTGNLSDMALERCNKALEVFQEHKDSWFITTGGTGEAFNVNPRSHAYFLKQYLVKNGVPEGRFLPFAESQNTIQDAKLSKTILKSRPVVSITVVSSDFHIDRVRYLFEKIYHGEVSNLSFVPAPAYPNPAQYDLEALIKHEKRAMAHLKKYGIDGYYNYRLDS